MDNNGIHSYGEFETTEFLGTEPQDKVISDLQKGKRFVKNNIYRDTSGAMCVSRIDMNLKDGYVQHDLIHGNNANPDLMDTETVMHLDKIGRNDKIPLRNRILVPGTYGASIYDVAFNSRANSGTADLFFSQRDNFVEYFSDNPASGGKIVIDNNTINPEFIGTSLNVKEAVTYNDLISYCRDTGYMIPDVAAFVTAFMYFAHEVVNLLMPKHIVLVMNSWTGAVDIPRRDYIPNINDPVLNIPDYDNKIGHIVDLMKGLINGKLLYVNVGRFYAKLSITPMNVVIKFVASIAPNYTLILNLPLIDNTIISDIEDRYGVTPALLGFGLNSGLNSAISFDNDIDIIKSMQANYYTNLQGLHSEELNTFIANNNIVVPNGCIPDGIDDLVGFGCVKPPNLINL